MKIYTKRGDDGNTSLLGGERVPKHSARIEACGDIDEVNAMIGMALSSPHSEQAAVTLTEIQRHLFVLGTEAATPDDSQMPIARIGEQEIGWLEEQIDQISDKLPELKQFILPGGSRTGAVLHAARTICRRAERTVAEIGEKEKISRNLLIYLNRLSDLLFVMARYENQEAGCNETPWAPRAEKPDNPN